MGRANKYMTHVFPYLDKIPAWYEYMTEEQVAARLGVGKTAFQRYKRDHPELREALRRGKADLVDELHSAIKRRALGYDYEEVKTYISKTADGKEQKTIQKQTRHMPPDLGSIHLLLKNLDDNWHNDDAETLRLKREELAIKRKKAEDAEW